MKIKTYNTIFWSILFSLLMISCQNSATVEDEVKDENLVSDELITIEKQQFAAEQMKLEQISAQNFAKTYQTTGKIITNYQSSAMVNSSISGSVSDIKVTLNQNVKKGDVLYSIESNEFIELQKNYLIAQAQIKPAKANYLRQNQLFNEKISSEKAFLQAESEYKTLLAELEASAALLANLKFPIDSFKDGEVRSYFNIYAPIGGQIRKSMRKLGSILSHKMY